MIRRPFALALVTGAVLVSTLTLAQTRPAPRAQHRAKPRPAADAGPGAQAEAPSLPLRGEDSRALDAGAIESRTLDGGTRVFRFGEVEVEGRLRNPQLVYFLRRVRAEFAAGDLGHRTFMRELSDTRHDPSF
jgi:hypothetical protein